MPAPSKSDPCPQTSGTVASHFIPRNRPQAIDHLCADDLSSLSLRSASSALASRVRQPQTPSSHQNCLRSASSKLSESPMASLAASAFATARVLLWTGCIESESSDAACKSPAGAADAPALASFCALRARWTLTSVMELAPDH